MHILERRITHFSWICCVVSASQMELNDRNPLVLDACLFEVVFYVRYTGHSCPAMSGCPVYLTLDVTSVAEIKRTL